MLLCRARSGRQLGFLELSGGKQTDKESLAVLTWAWRGALYASTTKTHLEVTIFDPKVALFTTFRYVISRTMAPREESVLIMEP